MYEKVKLDETPGTCRGLAGDLSAKYNDVNDVITAADPGCCRAKQKQRDPCTCKLTRASHLPLSRFPPLRAQAQQDNNPTASRHIQFSAKQFKSPFHPESSSMPPLSPSTTLPLDSSTLFLSSYKSFSSVSSQTAPPSSFDLLSVQSTLPSVPSNFPPSKLIPKTRFIVDAFKSSGDFSVSYFLSHFHADHYAGIGPTWSKGMIFCSDTTARLLVEILNVSRLFVVSLPLNETVKIDGCDVTLIDANHCPGAVQFLFNIGGERYVHTGDFRFCESMKADPALNGFVGADAVFLDTTYCNPKWAFPSQVESVDYVVKMIERIKKENSGIGKSILFLVSTYVVGKERLLIEISNSCGCLLHVDGRKMAVLRALGLADSAAFTEDASSTDVHVVGWNVLGETWPYFRPNFVRMNEIMVEKGYSMAVGFVPTGWVYGAKRDGFAVRAKESCEIHLVPYSEHSSYDELRKYVRFLRPKRLIPTVGLDIEKLDSKHASSMQKHFVGLVDEMANKQEFLMSFHRRLREGDEKVAGTAGTDSNKVDMEKEDNSPLTNMETVYSLKDSDMQKDKYIGMAEELQDCLPKWVTMLQILDLLTKSNGDIVKAVSDFYERETELHEEAVANATSVTGIVANATSVTGTVANATSVTGCGMKLMKFSLSQPEVKSFSSACNQNITLKQDKKLTNTSCSIKSTVSPRKRKMGKGTERKMQKKAKSSLTPESSGCKQSTITKFFGKLVPNAAQVDGHSSAPTKQCVENRDFPPDDAVGSNKVLDQFLQIINSSISRDDATSILEKAKGDVNLALDMHYSNYNIGVHEDNEGRSKLYSLPVLTQHNVIGNEASCTKETNALHLSEKGHLPLHSTGTSVSLPLEKYCPVEHGCLIALSPEDVLPAVYLCSNKIAADHENKELNIGGSLVSAALEEACGTNRSKIREMYNDLGDLGDVAQQCRQTQSLLAPPNPLSIREFTSVEAGSGSTIRKKSLIVNILRSCREREMKFLVRTLVRNLRIGAMMRTVLPALAQAVALNSSLHLLCEGASKGLKVQLQNYKWNQPSSEAIPRYDGQRAQIHKLKDGSIQVFSRNGEETTSRFPGLVNIVEESCKPAALTFILDTEVVAVNRKNGNKLMSFQQLSSRERGSKDSSISMDKIKVEAKEACLNNEATLSKMNSFLEEAFNSSCEGIMVKSLDVDAGYAASKRSDSWLKVKRDYVEGLNDSLDLVPIGAWHGNGRKAGWYSPFLMACFNPDTEEFQSVCRVMSGFSDTFYAETFDTVTISEGIQSPSRWAHWMSNLGSLVCGNPRCLDQQCICDHGSAVMKEFFSGDKILSKKPPYYQTAEVPDLWFSPEIVWEIRGADFTISPVHQAAVGLVHSSKGISVRFPRFIQSVSDRTPEDCSTAADIADLFRSQTRKTEIAGEL
ncbi:hypothetical protein ACLOJK_032900 [Asimina triloba]